MFELSSSKLEHNESWIYWDECRQRFCISLSLKVFLVITSLHESTPVRHIWRMCPNELIVSDWKDNREGKSLCYVICYCNTALSIHARQLLKTFSVMYYLKFLKNHNMSHCTNALITPKSSAYDPSYPFRFNCNIWIFNHIRMKVYMTLACNELSLKKIKHTHALWSQLNIPR